MRRAALMLTAAALVLPSVVACASYEQGQVTGKRFQPERTWTTTEIECTQGVRGACWSWGPGTRQHHEPDRHLLTIAWSDQRDEFDVPANVWSLCEVGESYPNCAEPH